MAEFTLDTSGRVECASSFQPIGWAIWSDLTPFQQGYIEAALRSYWLTLALAGPMFAERCAFRHLAPSALERILKDCACFENLAGGLGLTKLGEREGRYFYVGRNSGSLTDAFAAAFPPLHVFLNDAGQVVLREAG